MHALTASLSFFCYEVGITWRTVVALCTDGTAFSLPRGWPCDGGVKAVSSLEGFLVDTRYRIADGIEVAATMLSLCSGRFTLFLIQTRNRCPDHIAHRARKSNPTLTNHSTAKESLCNNTSVLRLAFFQFSVNVTPRIEWDITQLWAVQKIGNHGCIMMSAEAQWFTGKNVRRCSNIDSLLGNDDGLMKRMD